MRISPYVGVLALLLVLTACSLSNENKNCVGEPGEAGGGVSVCTKPPPAQFSQLGN